ncbi:putative class V chitinase [Hypomontagnella submonticulosa]|nr:putative class V chitinase [Hypomontagnella submonticulosa]
MHIVTLGMAILATVAAADSPSIIARANSTWHTTPQLPRNSSQVLRPLYQPWSKDTPIFHNDGIVQALSVLNISSFSLSRRAVADDLPDGVCAPGIPCRNGACCSNTGVCSFSKSSCGPDVCISNCNATAPCGQDAKPEDAMCPLNVCCSQYGFCGSIDLFCGNGCQEGFGSCGPPKTPSCAGNSAITRRIGYYESWANTRTCDKRSPDDLDLTGITHLNFAFAFFDPKTYQISPMDSNSGSLYNKFTGLKSKKSSLQTWISIGGWSFNDDTNTPNTRTAFSDMASSAEGRQKFIDSLQNFMQTYGFDGVDIDWEYPAADDRGGKDSDFGNFPELIAEMRQTFGNSYGISLTLPSSFWYLQHFDVVTMQDYVDWFNFMSYDIHGTWDSSNRFTGPYIRPHTNLTEIEDGLSLLWRAGVKPEKVVLGLGWYGRSFTLADPGCHTPNGVCQFTEGAAPGECTKSAGTLSNAEIKRILDSGVGVEEYDATAAVKWLTWNTNQWVSYDDGITIQQKIKAANNLCLGGTMIWALDQDNTDGDSMSDMLGVGTANGVTDEEAKAYKEQMNNAVLQKEIASSCYWTLCGKPCEHGYFDTTEAKGQIANVQQNSVCTNGEVQTLCCAPGTTMGTCSWEGFRGVGLPCTPVCNDTEAIIVAQNSNSYQGNEGGQLADLTCTGGFQAYCCSGFVPSPKTNTGNIFLYGQGVFTKRNLITARDLEARGKGTAVVAGGLTFGVCAAAVSALIAAAPFTFGISLLGIPAEIAVCAAAGIAVTAVGFASKPSTPSQPPPKPKPPVAQPHTGVPTTITTGGSVRASYGQWPILDFGSVSQTSSCDCFVTYTCRYGLGWDEVCDNQRWAINKMLNGRTVYHVLPVERAPGRNQASWANQRNGQYRTLVQGQRNPSDARCAVDEFPMGNLEESGNHNPQACRLVNTVANRNQGNDYRMWKSAQWRRCSSFRRTICGSNDPPPATWKFGSLLGNRGVGAGQHFISAYGFDSQTSNSLCFASYTYTDANDARQNTMVADHGFRALNDDPMFDPPYNWPRQNWKVNPAPKASAAQRPVVINSAAYLKRGLVQEILAATATSPSNGTVIQDLSTSMCHVDPSRGDLEGVDLDYEELLFEDMYGNAVDGRTCDIIYDDVSQVKLLIDEDGNVEYVYEDELFQKDIPVTSSELIVAPTDEAARPSDSFDSLPVSTTGGHGSHGSVVTEPPKMPTEYLEFV